MCRGGIVGLSLRERLLGAGEGGYISLLVLLVLILLLVVPIAYLIASSVSLEQFVDVITSVKIPPDGELYTVYSYPGYKLIYITGPDYGPIINSLLVASIASLSVIFLSMITVLASLSMSRSRWLLGYLLPLLASIPMPFLSAYAIIHLFHRDLGIVNIALDHLGAGFRIAIDGLAGVALYQIIHFLPLAHLLLLSYAENIDRGFIEASWSLGARAGSTIIRILVPLMRPAIIAVWSLIFILSIEDLVGPLAFSRNNAVRNLISYQAYMGFVSEYGYQVGPRVASQVLIMLIIAIAMLIPFYRYLYVSRIGVISVRRIYIEIRGVWGLLLRIFASALLISPLAPNAMVLLYSFTRNWFLSASPSFAGLDNYVDVVSSPYYYRAVINTLIYTVVSSLLILVLGYLSAYSSMRLRGGLALATEALSMAPLVIPGVAVGIAYYQLFHSIARGSPMDPVYMPWIYLIATYTVRRLPYMVRPLEASLQSIPRSYEEASSNLGAGVARTMWGIGFPMIFGSVSTGLLVSSIHVMAEVSTSLILIGNVAVSSAHPSPITPVIASLLIYDPQLIHRASSMLILTIAIVIIISLAISTSLSKILRLPRSA